MFFIFATVLLREHIKQCAHEAGFALCGVARARVLSEQADLYERALAASGPSALPYLARDLARRLDPARLVEGARTVVVCAVNYRNERSGGYPEGFDAPKIASYALSGTYQPKIRAMLARMARRLGLDAECGTVAGRGSGDDHGAVSRCGWRAVCDTSAILEKAWAVEAGLGWVGRNSLLVTPRHGSFLLLGELVTVEECDGYDEPYSGVGCGVCRRCVDGCPAGALVPQQPQGAETRSPDFRDGASGRQGSDVAALDTRRCVSALTIEKAPLFDVGPERLHGWIFGCDECQSVCPYNKLSPQFGNPLFAPRLEPADFPASEWLSMTPERFAETFADTPLERAGQGRLKKNLHGAKKEAEKF